MKIVKVSARAPPCQGMVESWGVVSTTGKRKTPGSLCQWAICLFGGGKGLLRARKNGQWSSCSGMLLVGARTLRVFHLHIRGKEPYKDIKEVSGQISSNQFLLGDLCCYVCLDTPHPTAGLCLGKVEEQPNSCYSLLRVRKSRVLHILLWPLFSFRLVHMKGRLMLGYSLSWWLPWGE